MQSRLLFERTGSVRPRFLWIFSSESRQLKRRLDFPRAFQSSSKPRVAVARPQRAVSEDVTSIHPQTIGEDKQLDFPDPPSQELGGKLRRGRPKSSPSRTPILSGAFSHDNPSTREQNDRSRSGRGPDRRHNALRLGEISKTEDPLQHALRVVQRAETEAFARAEAAGDEERAQVTRLSARLEEVESKPGIEHLQSLLPLSKNNREVVAWILNAHTADDAAERLFSSECSDPIYVMSEILRREGIPTKTFRDLVIYGWRHCVSPPTTDLPVAVQENAFMVMICRLLDHARKLLPPAVVSIAHMTVKYFEQLAASSLMTENSVDPTIHARISSNYNLMLHRLSLPASLNPFKSMAQNWKAQRVLLESANRFQPPLELNRLSYRSVCTVLLALRKSPQEEKFSSLLERSWPPWRREQDGMDAGRPAHEDLSRVNQALARMVEAGYQEEPIDRAIKILGGRESDGTPTIHTRYLFNLPAQLNVPVSKQNLNGGGILNSSTETPLRSYDLLRYVPTNPPQIGPRVSPRAAEWAAKIEATRDVQEAWAAFSSFPTESGHRSMWMYFAMIKKLVYDDRLTFLGQRPSHVPGDGPEVFPVVNDNLSDDMKIRLKPPRRDELYANMIDEGHSPRGRFLAFLLLNARTPSHAVHYLQDSNLRPKDVQKLISPDRSITPEPSSDDIPQSIFVAFIHFVSHPVLWDRIGKATQFSPSPLEHDPFGHAFHVLQCQESVCRPAWNAFFKGIARQGATIDPDYDLAWNDQASWALLLRAYQKSKELGLEVDHDGFQFMCRGLEKALLAECENLNVLDEETSTDRGRQLLKDLFRKMGERLDDELYLPRLAFRLGGTQLHAYIRVAGLCHDIDELKYIMDWMVENSECMLDEADESANGRTRLRRALIAIRVFADHFLDEAPETVASIRSRMEDLEWEWGGWPDDGEANEYRKAWEAKEERKDNRLYRTWNLMGFTPEDTMRTQLRRENMRMINDERGYSEDEDKGL